MDGYITDGHFVVAVIQDMPFPAVIFRKSSEMLDTLQKILNSQNTAAG